jgi:hypothetical protein
MAGDSSITNTLCWSLLDTAAHTNLCGDAVFMLWSVLFGGYLMPDVSLYFHPVPVS